MKRKCDAVDTITGAKIKLFRQMRGISRNELADALGVTHQQIHRYENGTNRISAARLHGLCAAFNVSLIFFFSHTAVRFSKVGGSDLADEKGVLRRHLASSVGLELNRAFFAIRNGKTKRTVIGLVKAVAATKGPASTTRHVS